MVYKTTEYNAEDPGAGWDARSLSPSNLLKLEVTLKLPSWRLSRRTKGFDFQPAEFPHLDAVDFFCKSKVFHVPFQPTRA